jgi:hypothetical protein
MLIATFGPHTALAGQGITREGDRFVLEGHGPLTPEEMMEHDRRGDLVWANDGARAWVGSKVLRPAPAVATDATQAAVAAGDADAAAAPSVSGAADTESWRALLERSNLRRAAFPAVATTAVLWIGTYLVGLIPVHQLGVALLSPAIQNETSPDNHWWVVWSLLCHFGGSVWIRRGSPLGDLSGPESITYSFNVSGLLALLLLVGVVALIGLWVRRKTPATWQGRLVAVLATALVMAVVAALAALLGGETLGSSRLISGSSFFGYLMDQGSGRATVGFGVASTFVRAFIMTLVCASFAFGLVRLLPVPHASALRGAMGFAVIPALVVALFAPFLVVSKMADIAGEARSSPGDSPAETTSTYAAGTLGSPAAGAAFVPLSFGAEATLGLVDTDLSLVDGFGDDYTAAGSNIGSLLTSASGGRVFALAGDGGTKGKLLALLLVVGVLALWVYSLSRYLSTVGVPGGLDGLKLGAYLGLLAGIAVALLAALLTFRMSGTQVSISEDSASRVSLEFAAGMTGFAYFYIVFILTLTGACIGYLFGRLRPSPIRHQLDFGRLTARGRAVFSLQPPAPRRSMPTGGAGTASSLSSPSTETSPSTLATADDIADRVGRLAKLHEQGLLTDEEFQSLKAGLIEQLPEPSS